MPTAVDPCIPLALLPPGCRARVMGEHQTDTYTPLPAVRTPAGQVITRWTLTDEERSAIARGADIYLTILTHGPMQPVALAVGQPDAIGLENWILS